MRPKITQKFAGLEFESHAWVKRKKKSNVFSAKPVKSMCESAVSRLQTCGSQPWLRHCNHLGRLPEGFHPDRL